MVKADTVLHVCYPASSQHRYRVGAAAVMTSWGATERQLSAYEVLSKCYQVLQRWPFIISFRQLEGEMGSIFIEFMDVALGTCLSP